MGRKGTVSSQKDFSPELQQLLQDIARVFKFLRKKTGYGSAKTFSEVQDVNRSQFSRYETGKVDMKISSLVSIADLLGLSIEDIFNPAFLSIGKDENAHNALAEKSEKAIMGRVRNQVFPKDNYKVTDQDIVRTVKILTFCAEPKSRKNILKNLNLKNSSANFKRNAGLALKQGWLAMTIPDKPNSRNQCYVITGKGKKVLGLNA